MTAAIGAGPRIPREVPDWHEQGLCQYFPDLSWVHPGAVDAFTMAPSADDRRLAEAACRVVCSGCPVRLACAVGALERGERWGMWGGLDYEDRKKVARRFGYPTPGDPPPHGTNSRRVKWGCDCAECRAAHALYESMRREKKRAAPNPFARRIGELQEARGWSPRTLAERVGMPAEKILRIASGVKAPTADVVTAFARAFADDPDERARLAEELHRLAGTAVGTVEVRGRRVLVMSGSRADVEGQHLRALPDASCSGATVQLRLDRATYRRRVRRRRRRR